MNRRIVALPAKSVISTGTSTGRWCLILMMENTVSCAFAVGMLIVVGVFAQDPGTERDKVSQPRSAQQPHRIRIDEDAQKAKLVRMVPAVYPQLLGKRIDGTVVLHVIVGANGSVKSARPVSGLPNLRDSAVNAVQQWQYKPTLQNGVAVEVDTTVSIVFAPLSQQSATPKSVEPETGTICVAARADDPFRGQVIPPTGDVSSQGLQVKIDKQPVISWPQRQSLKIEGLDLKERHLLAVVDARGRPIESLWFRFTTYDSKHLCMSYDGYGIGLDADGRHFPWCKCKYAD
jgi:TonB family protein